MQQKRFAFILGTRPEIVKMAPVIRAAQERNLDFILIHTGQHYSFNMDAIFMRDLSMPEPDYRLEVGSGTHGAQTGLLLQKIEEVLQQDSVDVAFVQGDTNTVVAGALAASKMHIDVGHIEAGLRSNFFRMPEEINRIVTDHISSYLFVPTKEAFGIAVQEGIDPCRVHITGNTIVDSVYYMRSIAQASSTIVDALRQEQGSYILFTTHRPENVDNPLALERMIRALEQVSRQYSYQIIWPIHPRTAKQVEAFGLVEAIRAIPSLSVIEPLGFMDFIALQASARLILTDSGGLQEESCIMHVPCVTLRDNTERPESVSVGANVLVGTDEQAILEGVKIMLGSKRDWKNPFGDGTAAQQILDAAMGPSLYS